MKPNIQKTSISSSYFNEQYNKNLGNKNINNNDEKKNIKFFAPTNQQNIKKNERKIKQVDFRSVLSDIDSDDDSDDDDDGPWLKIPKKLSAHELEEVSSATSASASSTSSSSLLIESSIAPTKPAPLVASSFKSDYPLYITPLESNLFIIEPDQDQEKWDKINERKNSALLPPRPPRGSYPPQAFSYYYGQGTGKNYDGTSWNTPSKSDKVSDDEENNFFLPKKNVQTIKISNFTYQNITSFTGGSDIKKNSGVKFARFANNTGHLLLAGDLNGNAYIFSNNQPTTYSNSSFTSSTSSSYNLLRSYHGHTEGIHTGEFSPSNLSFLTSSYDRYIRVWDTETGESIATLTNRLMNYSVKYSPYDSNIILSGTSNNKIFQWDIRCGKVVQEYNYHLNFINDLTYLKKDLNPKILENNIKKDKELKQLEDALNKMKIKLDEEKQKLNKLEDKETHEKLLIKSIQNYENEVENLTNELQTYKFSSDEYSSESASLKFISCSDDNKILYWENNIPVPIKYLQDSELQTITSLVEHPTQSFVLGKCITNKVLIFSYSDTNIKLLKNHYFTLSNQTSSSPPSITSFNFSPNGKFFLSGDSQGGVTIWDWKTRRVLKKFPAHTPLTSSSGHLISSVSSIDWHPNHPSRIATACLNGEIKIWE